jgi:hypothetical protein
MSTRGRGAAVVIAAMAVTVAGLVVVPRIGATLAGASAIHAVDELPQDIELCGRQWAKDVLVRTFTKAGIREQSGVDPVVVDPGPFAACPPGPCTDVAQPGPCHTVIWVRVGQDAYIDYSLQGGP